MDNSPPQNQGIGALGWIGIGCGGIILLGIIASVAFYFLFAPKLKQVAEEFQKNPTRAMATTMVTAGVAELVAEDDVNKRYTIKEKQSGRLTTIYWDEKKQTPETVPGDFSAIPTDAGTTAPAPSAPPAPPAPVEPSSVSGGLK